MRLSITKPYRFRFLSEKNNKALHIIQMNKILTIILFISSFAYQSLAQQRTGWEIYGEGNGNEVRLLWTAGEWNDSLQGMIVKRRIYSGTTPGKWEILTKPAIVPLLSATKNLSNVSNDAAIVAALKNKMTAQAAEFASMDSVSFHKFITNRGGLTMFSFSIAKDYDRALMSGFGFYDKKITATSGTTVEYGLFGSRTDGGESNMLASFQWKAGNKPAYKLKATTSIKGNKTKNTIHAEWQVTTASFKAPIVLQGFHIDRVENGIRTRLTKSPIWPNTAKETFPIFIDDKTDASKKYTYELIPVSIFGYESSPLVLVYDPLQVPGVFAVTATTTYKEGDTDIVLSWALPAESERYVQHYVVEERITYITYKTLKDSLSKVKTHTIKYDTTREYPAHYDFRITAVLKDGYDAISSNNASVDYAPRIVPDKITEAKAVLEKRDNKNVASITWKAVPGASGYYLFSQQLNGTEMIMEGSIGLIKNNFYVYPLSYPVSSKYVFAVAAVNEKDNLIGEMSERISVVTPSAQLLRVYFSEFKEAELKKTFVSWNYNEPADLIGYRLYENGLLIADEKILKKGTLQWKSLTKKPGRYEYAIEAVTGSGIVSERSLPRLIVIK